MLSFRHVCFDAFIAEQNRSFLYLVKIISAKNFCLIIIKGGISFVLSQNYTNAF